MKEFDYKEYVTSTGATVSGRLRLLKEEEENTATKEDTESTEGEEEKAVEEPSTDTANANIQKRQKLNQLVQQRNLLVDKLRSGEITIDQYKQNIGSIPQQIKTLTADLAKTKTANTDKGT